MNSRRNKQPLTAGWNQIPAGRRHFYIYVLLVLTAVVGNSIHRELFPIEQDDERALEIESARIKGVKESTATLYQ